MYLHRCVIVSERGVYEFGTRSNNVEGVDRNGMVESREITLRNLVLNFELIEGVVEEIERARAWCWSLGVLEFRGVGVILAAAT